MSEVDGQDSTSAAEPEVMASRYDRLIGLQLKEDARYDLCREVWRRVSAMILRAAAEYLGCAPDRLSMEPSRPASYLDKQRHLALSVELANGFKATVPLTLGFSVREARAAPGRYRRHGETVDEIRMAWTPEIKEQYQSPDYWTSVRAEVVSVTLRDEHGYPRIEIPFAYYPRDESRKIPPPDPFVLAMSAFGREGALALNEDSRWAMERLHVYIEEQLMDEIRNRVAERGGADGTEPEAPPKWL